MKTVLKLLIAAIIVNATAQGGLAVRSYYELKDSAQQLVMFGGGASTEQLHDAILLRAASLSLPLGAGDIAVRREGLRTIARASYVQPVEFFPNQPYPITFSFEVDALMMGSMK